jgi:hypothetical protein
MAKKSAPSLNDTLRALLHAPALYDQHGFLSPGMLQGLIARLDGMGVRAEAVHDNSDGAARAKRAYFDGLRQAFEECGRDYEVATALQANPNKVKKPQRVFALVPKGSADSFAELKTSQRSTGPDAAAGYTHS